MPSLLAGLDNESHYAASVEGLRVILGVRPTTFNGVAPKLLKQPITSAGLRALGDLAGVAGGRLAICLAFKRVCLCVWHMTINSTATIPGAFARCGHTSRNSPMPVTASACVFALLNLWCAIVRFRRMTSNSTATIQGLRPMQTNTI